MNLLPDSVRGYVTVDQIIAEFLDDTDYQDGDRFDRETMINWVSKAELEIGTSRSMINKEVALELKDFVAYLPCDFFQLRQVTFGGSPLHYNGSTFRFLDNTRQWPAIQGHMAFNIENDRIVANIRDGELWMSYTALPHDEKGNPLVRNTIEHRNACISYLKYKTWDARKFRNPDQASMRLAEDYKREFIIARNKARNQDHLLTIEEQEYMKRMYVRLRTNYQGFDTNFRNLDANGYNHQDLRKKYGTERF